MTGLIKAKQGASELWSSSATDPPDRLMTFSQPGGREEPRRL